MKIKPSEKLLQIAQEIAFAKALASNDETLRNKALRRLKKWIISKSNTTNSFTEEGFIRLWRGLFYNVWMADKPLMQEETVENISNLVHCFVELSDALIFIKCFFKILSETWQGLDYNRLDKYLMFVRRFLRQSMTFVKNHDWKKEDVQNLVEVFKGAFQSAPLGLLMHICEIYLQELAKVSKGRLDKVILPEFLKPFGEVLAASTDERVLRHITDFIYMYLLEQSDLGIKHQLKFEAWKKMGFPGGNINVLEDVEMSSDEEIIDESEDDGNTCFDARAGNVDVYLHHLVFDESSIINHLTELKRYKTTTTIGRKRLNFIINRYAAFRQGKYTLGIHKIPEISYNNDAEVIESAAMDLMLEGEIENEEDKPQPAKKSKKQDKKPIKGKWLITSEQVKNELNNECLSPGNLNSGNNWQVSNTASTKDTKQVSDSSLDSSLKQNNSKGNKRKCKRKQQSLKSKEDYLEHKECRTNINDNNEEIQHCGSCQSVPLMQDKSKTSTFYTPNSGKKVKFSLKRNTIQDEKEYRRSIKSKPKLKFNESAQPAVGVLKSTPFSSPINPFIVSPAFVNF